MVAATEVHSEELVAPPVHPLREFWFYFSDNKGAVAGLFTVVAIVSMAILADVLAPYSPIEQFRDHLLVPPVWQEGGSWAYVLGTDATGRDMLSRLLHGSRYSLFVGVIVVTLSLSAGISIGLIAASFRGALEAVIMRMMDVILAIPSLLLALVIVAILGPSLENAMVAIAVVYLPHFVRLTRASAISEMSKDYV
ncbi:MAG TPA: ABC transporter permease subunit, partial [Kiloniellales bacterium]